MGKENILGRVERRTSITKPDEVLGQLKGSDLVPLLLYSFQERIKGIKPLDLIKLRTNDRLVAPGSIDQRTLVKIDHVAYETLPPFFRAVELSPVNPLGINHILAGVSAMNTLHTDRLNEVLADPGTSLAVEAALERKQHIRDGNSSQVHVNLATSSRLIRTQRYDTPGFVPHFKMFALATAGPDTGHRTFEIKSLISHIEFYLQLIDRISQSDFHLSDVRLEISHLSLTEASAKERGISIQDFREKTGRDANSPFKDSVIPSKVKSIDADIPGQDTFAPEIKRALGELRILETSVVQDLKTRFPAVDISFNLHRIPGVGYYSGPCFKIFATNKDGVEFPLVDGGLTDWTQKLLQLRNEQFLVSGIGTEMIASNFRK